VPVQIDGNIQRKFGHRLRDLGVRFPNAAEFNEMIEARLDTCAPFVLTFRQGKTEDLKMSPIMMLKHSRQEMAHRMIAKIRRKITHADASGRHACRFPNQRASLRIQAIDKGCRTSHLHAQCIQQHLCRKWRRHGTKQILPNQGGS